MAEMTQKYFTSDLHDEIDTDEFVAFCILHKFMFPRNVKCSCPDSNQLLDVLFG